MDWSHLKKFQRLLPKIPRTRGREVVTRFPPEPSGYLHLGHVKALVLNYALAQKYGGKCLLRFDDTNPANCQPEYQEGILTDLKRFGFSFSSVSWSSQFFNRLIKVADQLVDQGLAYVDQTEPDEMKQLRRLGIASEYRERSLEVQQTCWDWLKQGKIKGCLRLKIQMNHVYGPMRDPVIYRYCYNDQGEIIFHPKAVGPAIYPTYDFACPLIDSWQGVTHALRSDEYFDRDRLYKWLLEKVGLPSIHLVEFSRLEMPNTLMSKRLLRQVVADQGLSWDDPRMPTIRGLLNRGAVPKALIRFVADQGLCHHGGVVLEWQKLWTFNKQELDPLVPRYNCLEVGASHSPGKEALFPTNWQQSKTICQLTVSEVDWSSLPRSAPRHPRQAEMGTKEIPIDWSQIEQKQEIDLWLEEDDAQRLKEGDEVTLVHWGNIIIQKIYYLEEENLGTKLVTPRKVKSIQAKHSPTGDPKTTVWKLTWLPDLAWTPPDQSLVTGWIYRYRYLLTIGQLPEDSNWRDYWDVNNWQAVPILIEPAVVQIPSEQVIGTQIQFQRKGFYRRIADHPDGRPVWIEHVYFSKKK